MKLGNVTAFFFFFTKRSTLQSTYIQHSILFFFFQENHFTVFLSSVSFSERVCFVLYSLICFIWLMLSWCILKDFKQLFNIVSK